MDTYLLSLLIFTPALGALVLLMLPGRLASLFRSVTLVVSLIQLLVLIRIFQLYQPSTEGYQLMEQASWITLTLFDGAIFRAEYLVA
ncbi:MAG: NADH-quinone oxidoreductase subunit M, partial [Bacteroidota bacterium]